MQNIYKATSTATSKTLPQHHHKYLILKIHVAEMVYITGKTSRATAAWCSARRPWRTIKLRRWELMQDDSIGNQEQQRVRNSTTTTKSAHKSSKASWLAPADDNFLISHPDNKGNTCYTFGSQITTTWWFSWLHYLVIFIWMTTCVENVAKLLPSSCETLITTVFELFHFAVAAFISAIQKKKSDMNWIINIRIGMEKMHQCPWGLKSDHDFQEK